MTAQENSESLHGFQKRGLALALSQEGGGNPAPDLTAPPPPGVANPLAPCSKPALFQEILIAAPVPGGTRFSALTVAPERSRRVLAMNKPSPSPDPSSDLARRSVLVVT